VSGRKEVLTVLVHVRGCRPNVKIPTKQTSSADKRKKQCSFTVLLLQTIPHLLAAMTYGLTNHVLPYGT